MSSINKTLTKLQLECMRPYSDKPHLPFVGLMKHVIEAPQHESMIPDTALYATDNAVMALLREVEIMIAVNCINEPTIFGWNFTYDWSAVKSFRSMHPDAETVVIYILSAFWPKRGPHAVQRRFTLLYSKAGEIITAY